MLRVGDIAPDFRAPDNEGREIHLVSLLENGPTVLFFYPRDFTKVCSAQAKAFQQSADAFRQCGAQIVGISVDGTDEHRRFAEELGLQFPLVADPNREITRAYRVLRPLMGVAKRTTFVVGPDQRVRSVFKKEFSSQDHVTEALKALGQAAA